LGFVEYSTWAKENPTNAENKRPENRNVAQEMQRTDQAQQEDDGCNFHKSSGHPDLPQNQIGERAMNARSMRFIWPWAAPCTRSAMPGATASGGIF
jgi:hypothetical protein